MRNRKRPATQRPINILRARWEDRPNREKYDSILRNDYMGSAEFEFGAIPDSYERMQKAYSETMYSLFCLDEEEFINVKGESLYLFCQTDEVDVIKEHLLNLKTNSIRLREYIKFYVNYQKPEERKYIDQNISRHENFWWDIDHDFMFFFGNEELANKFLNVAFPQSDKTII